MTWTLCTSGSAIEKAGANVSSDIKTSGSALANWSDESQDYISSVAHQDVVTNFSSFTTEGKKILQRLSSNLIAFEMVGYDDKNFNSQRSFETKLDILKNNIDKDTNLIDDDILKTYLGVT